ncbi:hypothetical protein FQZ97_779930 [compost metagenome]
MVRHEIEQRSETKLNGAKPRHQRFKVQLHRLRFSPDTGVLSGYCRGGTLDEGERHCMKPQQLVAQRSDTAHLSEAGIQTVHQAQKPGRVEAVP